ncbi:MAG: glucose-1-phosphate adenylyltransferase [Ignavibacteria bacterium]|jgi:glucose-1-phosphate adenylyltransferase|nr:glucose-1-phosphate adenylyltransferase [Ignavibacteria bacterium]MDH7528195.1 glucose-1-phosphate adenylyltransferase [Ignavibacteria bacterium]
MEFSASVILRNTITMILAGGQGERLYPLTAVRSKPAVPFGGKYRIIDFTLSNCLNSGLRKIYVLTQYKSDSLNQHLYEGWNIFQAELGEFIYSIPPQLKLSGDWYLGTANAIYQNKNLIHPDKAKWILILSGDHIYKMDYFKLIQYHIQKDAELTIATIKYDVDQARRFGVLATDENQQIVDFQEKPRVPIEIPNEPGYCYVNMGIYVFNAEALIDVLETDDKNPNSSHDFGKDVIPAMINQKRKIYAWHFIDENKSPKPYWRDIGTIDSYYAASMDLISVTPEFNIYDKEWPIRTFQAQYPPMKTISHEGERVGRALSSLVCDGTIISGGLVERSILGHGVRVNSYSYITDSIIFDNVVIGRRAKIRRAIIDKNVIIPEDYEIGFDPEKDKQKFTISETGIVVIPKNTVLK